MKKAFTLIELLLVLALISITLCILVPNSNIFKDLKEREEVREFKKDIMFARNRAITTHSKYDVKLIFEDNQYIIKGLVDSDTIKAKTFSSGLRLSRLSNISSIMFNSAGIPMESGTICLVDRKGKVYEIAISPVTGRVEVKYDEWE